jgi:hypothetical protein
MGTDEKKFLAEIRRERESSATAARRVRATEKRVKAQKRWRGSVTLRERLDSIIERPGCEIGAPPDVESLFVYLAGYRQALADAGVDDGFFDGFQDFVQQQYGESAVANGKSWAKLMRERSANAAAGFEEFKRLWSLFVASDSQSSITGG